MVHLGITIFKRAVVFSIFLFSFCLTSLKWIISHLVVIKHESSTDLNTQWRDSVSPVCTHEDTCSQTLTFYAHASTVTHRLKHCSLLCRIIKAHNCCPRASFLIQTRGGFFTEEQAFVWMNKGNILPPQLLSPLNPIMCPHASPTRLFPSYRRRRLPILLNCLLCEVMAEEQLMRASCPRLYLQLTRCYLTKGDSTWDPHSTSGKLHWSVK